MKEFCKLAVGIASLLAFGGALILWFLGIGRKNADDEALKLAEEAATAALDGRVEDAQQMFAKAHQGTTNLRVLYLAYEFYKRTGDLATAEEMLERCLAISGRDAETADTAAALCNLGLT